LIVAPNAGHILVPVVSCQGWTDAISAKATIIKARILAPQAIGVPARMEAYSLG